MNISKANNATIKIISNHDVQKSRLVYNCLVSATLVMQQEWSVIHRPLEYSYLYRATTTEKSHRISLSFIGHSDFNYDQINVKMALKTLWNSIVDDLIMKCKNVVAGGDFESWGRPWTLCTVLIIFAGSCPRWMCTLGTWQFHFYLLREATT